MSGTILLTDKETYDFPLHLFHQGKNYEAFEFFGSHPAEVDGKKGVVFRVWAPRAKSVSLVCDDNNWDRDKNPMYTVADGIWEIFMPDIPEYFSYKYSVETCTNRIVMKSDPYGYHMETRPNTATKYVDISTYKWNDAKWYEEKKKKNIYKTTGMPRYPSFAKANVSILLAASASSALIAVIASVYSPSDAANAITPTVTSTSARTAARSSNVSLFFICFSSLSI